MNSEFRISNSESARRSKPLGRRSVRHFESLGFIRPSSFAIRVCALLSLFLLSPSARACSVCFGGTDTQLGRGMLAGVLVLLLVILSVLGGFVVLFVYLARRAAAMAALENQSTESKA